MAGIDGYLQAIMDAVYGEEVRGSIHDAIQQSYSDANDVVKVSTTQPSEENVKLWVKPTSDEYQVPTYAEHTELAGQVTSLKNKIPDPPSQNGTYKLTVTVNGSSAVYSWVSDSTQSSGQNTQDDDEGVVETATGWNPEWGDNPNPD